MTDVQNFRADNPLQGITVIELGQFIAGPMAGQQLADFGARVIKIERPGTGDPFRTYDAARRIENYGYNFRAYNRKKLSVALDIQSPEGAAVLKRLIKKVDVVLENFRPGVMERAGLGYDVMRSLNENIVYCSISGFAEDGPNRSRPAFDTIGQALSGMLHLFVDPSMPVMRGPTIVDQATGLQAAVAILAQLVGRNKAGRGARIDISMVDAAIGFIPDVLAAHTDVGLKINTTTRSASSQAFVMACGDGKLIAVQLGGLHKNWIALTNALGRPDFVEDERFKLRPHRVANWLTLMEEFRPVFNTQPRDVWVERLLAADLPCSEVRDISEVLDGSEVRHSKLFEAREHPQAGPLTMMKRVARIDNSRGPEQPLPALLGEHNDAILGEIGYAREEIQQLRDSGVLGQQPGSAAA
jgi:crotonobetainyl-CoA:carnitine CoA-transferase CaiB-like acyl-CoA transferase